MAKTQTRSAGRSRTRRQAQRKQGTSRTLLIGLGAVVLVLVGLALAGQANGWFVSLPVETFVAQSRDHIEVGATHPAYNSDPPTGGWHYANPAPAGFYEQPLPDEELVHNLEHGHVVIYYDCSKLADCNTVKTQLRGIYDRYNGWKIVVAPRQNRDAGAAIALTAWEHLTKLQTFDAARINAFINRFRDHGPEQTME